MINNNDQLTYAIRIVSREHSRRTSYTKADFKRLVEPHLLLFNASLTWHSCGTKLRTYHVTFQNEAEALAFRQVLTVQCKLVHRNMSYGFNKVQPGDGNI